MLQIFQEVRVEKTVPRVALIPQVLLALNYQRLLNAIGQILSSNENEENSMRKQLRN